MDSAFDDARAKRIGRLVLDEQLWQVSRSWLDQASGHGYSYNFTWGGVPIVQLPADIVMLQEIIMAYRPDAIIETGIARGGSAVFFSSMFAVLDAMLGSEAAGPSNRKYVGVDIEIRPHTSEVIRENPLLRKYGSFFEGSSTDSEIFSRVSSEVRGFPKRMVVLDSSHSHKHVLRELELYHALVPIGGFIVIFDTTIEWDDPTRWVDRDWSPGNSPFSAIKAFLEGNSSFNLRPDLSDKGLISALRGGILERVR